MFSVPFFPSSSEGGSLNSPGSQPNPETLGSSSSFNQDLYKELPNPQQAASTVLEALRSDEW